jgi:hypothetical protein
VVLACAGERKLLLLLLYLVVAAEVPLKCCRSQKQCDLHKVSIWRMKKLKLKITVGERE